MAMVTIMMGGKPITVNETSPGLFGSLGYQYVGGAPAVYTPSQGTTQAPTTPQTQPAASGAPQQNTQQSSQPVTQPAGLLGGVQAAVGNGTPLFMGNTAVIQVAGYPGTYLVDKVSKTVRPFVSDMAVFNAIPNITPQHIVTVPPSALSLGGMFGIDQGFHILDSKYSIGEDGKFLSLDASNSQLQARYGKAINQRDEQDAYLLLDGMIGSLRDNPNGGFPGSFIDTLKNDKPALAFMLSSLAYGGYGPGDVYSDMKRRYLISQGDTSLKNVNPISPVKSRDAYQVTDDGKQALSNPKLTPPTQIGTLDSSVMKLPLFQIPQEAFNTLIPIMNPDTQEYKDAVSKIQDAYHDVLLQQLSATTEQQKAIADGNWQTFRNNVQSQLGIQLSNDALDAWTQIQKAYGSFAQQGISGSGLEAESIDDYLRRVRAQGQQSRSYYQSQADSQEALYYQKYATPQQVKDLIASDPAKAQSWGLIPSADIKNALSFGTLKAKYPNLSDQEINDYIASTLDENGNYRSALYQTYMTSKLQTQQDQQLYKEGQVLNNSLGDEAKAYREFTTPDVAFLRNVSDPASVGAGMANPTINDLMGTPAQYSNIKSVIGGAYAPGGTTAPAPTVVNTPVASTTVPTLQTNIPSSYPRTSSLSTPPVQPTSPVLNTNPVQNIDTSFRTPALKPVSPLAGSTMPVANQQAKSSFNFATTLPSNPPALNFSTSVKTSTPSTVGGASASKTLSALTSGLNNIKNFGSNVAGGFKSLFGY